MFWTLLEMTALGKAAGVKITRTPNSKFTVSARKAHNGQSKVNAGKALA
jgi:hypothetical protein